MAIKPIQSDSSSSVKRSENKPSLPPPPAKQEESDAVRVSLKTDRPEKAPPPPPPAPPSYGPSRQSKEKNFKDIDSDGSGELSKEELSKAQERRQAEGKKTPFIDKALASYDQQTQASGKSGVTFEQFYKSEKAPPPPPPPKQEQASSVKES